ncbi:MAG: mannose-1-phosphate guanylyltransferase [Ignavibacteria bacterium]|nr:mannose-1-phosphate guanylyltransferase [Ignavibacteria bacterium]
MNPYKDTYYNKENKYAIIMAGGTGTRFWPKGTSKTPKQFLDIDNSGETLIQKTFRRLEGIFDITKIFIVTNAAYKNIVRKQLPQVPEENIILEPIGRNTAPCIGLSCLYIENFNPQAQVLAIPADQLTRNIKEFQEVVKSGLNFVEKHDGIVTIGINPTKPETGYGYIQYVTDEKIESKEVKIPVYKVKTFAEKPTLEIAKAFLKSGDFLWNAGMFIFRVSVMLQEIKMHLPELYDSLQKIKKNLYSKDFNKILEQVFSQVKSISIDYGVMEKSNCVYTIKGDFDWSDVGSWDEIYNLSKKDSNNNVLQGMTVMINSKNCYVVNEQRVTAVVGCEDLIIVDTDNGLLVCKRGESQSVREVVDYLRRKGYDQFI